MDNRTFDPAERRAAAEALFLEGYNCCQSVVLAYMDITGLDRENLLRMTSGFGGGMARMREVCGAVSGMVALAGFISPATDPSKHEERTANYALVQELAAAFREAKGSIICREILQLRADGNQPMESPEPSIRTPEYYKRRPCAAMVGQAAEILANKLNEMNKQQNTI